MGSQNTNSALRIGRVLIDDNGISQMPIFFIIGESFTLRWKDITAWSSSEMHIGSKRSGKQTIVSNVLELRTDAKVHFIARSVKDRTFHTIVNEVRKRIPEKETNSLLTDL